MLTADRAAETLTERQMAIWRWCCRNARGRDLSPGAVGDQFALDAETLSAELKALVAGCWLIEADPIIPVGIAIRPRLLSNRRRPRSRWRRRELAAAAARADSVCALCGEPVDLLMQDGPRQPTLDHITPQSLGGSHNRENLQLAHKGCNSRKGARVQQ